MNPSPESSLSSSDRFLSLPNTTVVVCTVVVTRLRIMRKPGRKRSSAPGKRSRPDWMPHLSGGRRSRRLTRPWIEGQTVVRQIKKELLRNGLHPSAILRLRTGFPHQNLPDHFYFVNFEAWIHLWIVFEICGEYFHYELFRNLIVKAGHYCFAEIEPGIPQCIFEGEFSHVRWSISTPVFYIICNSFSPSIFEITHQLFGWPLPGVFQQLFLILFATASLHLFSKLRISWLDDHCLEYFNSCFLILFTTTSLYSQKTAVKMLRSMVS